MTQFLPPNLLALFAPGPPLSYVPPIDKLREEKNSHPYTGVSAFLSQFEDPKETPAPVRSETKEERRERKQKERAEQAAYKLEQDIALWDPTKNEYAKGEPYRTLFVARINFDTSESKLKREFEEYGKIKKVTMVKNKMSGKPKGYAYIEFEREKDMIDAYKRADGKKIDGKRVVVDMERGRTVKGWRPRRLGGGLGHTRQGGNEENTKYSGRDDFGLNDSKAMMEDRDRNTRDDRRRSRSKDKNRRSRERDRRRRSRSRERKRSAEREVKREPGDQGNDRRRERRSSRERRRSRSNERKRKRSRSRSRGKKEKVKQVKEEMAGGYEGYPYGGMVPPPPQNLFVKREHDGGNYDQDMYNHQAPPMPPLPPQGNPYPSHGVPHY